MSTDISVKSFTASSDQAQTLGTATTRWGTVYAKEINDGEGGAIQVSEVTGALEFAVEKNHSALTAESRAAENSHPQSAITGLAEALQPATQTSVGLMSPGDKTKIDNITPDRIVYTTPEGNIRLPNSKKLQGASVGGEDYNLVELNQWDQVDVGSAHNALNFNSSARPTVQVGSESSSKAETIAFLSDISRQKSWDVDTVDDLVALTSAHMGDMARITTGEDAGDVYQLIANDPTILANWLNITRDGGVIAVNGKTGAVEVDLADFPDVQTALNAKTDLASLANYLPLAGGTLTGVLFINASTGSIIRPNRLDLGGSARLYGLGVFSGGALTFHSAVKYSWYLGNTSGSQTEVAYLNATDLYLGGTPLKTTITAKADAIVGEIRMLPFRPSELPTGWYYPSGDYFELTSTVGKALNSLPANYKSDWGIVVSGTTIRLFDPNKFFATDGGSNTVGRFFRPVDGTTRLPGSTEDDAIRNIIGSVVVMSSAQTHSFTGAFTSVGTSSTYTAGAGLDSANYGITLNASRTVPTASENRPFNVGLTPAVYLGVN